MNDRLAKTRTEIRELLVEFSKPVNKNVSEDQSMKDEAAFAASNLKNSNSNSFQRMKAIEFLEILNGNPYAQEHLLNALNDKETSVILKAINALGKIGDAKSISRLKECMQQAKSKQITAEISRLINKLEKKENKQAQD